MMMKRGLGRGLMVARLVRAARPRARGVDVVRSFAAARPAPALRDDRGGATGRHGLNPDDELDAFSARFLSELDGASSAADPVDSANLLRRLVKAGHLRFTDMKTNPAKFFLAHRLLTTLGLSGFGVRFTVQYNLFAGSILGLGGPEQIAKLDAMQAEGSLGCFLLTETQAGVLSGLIVNTEARWDASAREFVLHTPDAVSDSKNWISQGLCAEHGVVVAKLFVQGKDHGPHAFLMRLRESHGGAPMPGVTITDMGVKTVANDLDNARFSFDRVRLPRDALLNKFADVREDAYVQTTSERMRIEVIGQRLLTGRMAIAEAALVFAKTLHDKTEAYARSKTCNGLVGEVPLFAMPQVRNVFEESRVALDDTIAFCTRVERRLNACLASDTIPDDDLVEAIAVAKVTAIDVSVERVHRLRQEVGSYALMSDTGFELSDMLLCCKFAEGDSRILLQKIARDRLKKLKKGGLSGFATDLAKAPLETLKAANLARKLAAGPDMATAWDENWREVYELAQLVCDRHMSDAPHPPTGFEYPGFQEPIVERFQERKSRAQL